MKAIRSSLVALVLAGAVCGSASVATAQEEEPKPGSPQKVVTFFEVEFSDPTAWRCNKFVAPCLSCGNVSSSTSDVIVTPASGSTKQTYSIPVDAHVGICGQVIFIESIQ